MDELTQTFLATNQTAISLAVALLLGALIGLERGREAREKKAREPIAGIRTHALGLRTIAPKRLSLFAKLATAWASI